MMRAFLAILAATAAGWLLWSRRASAAELPGSLEPPMSAPSLPWSPWLDIVETFMSFEPPASAAIYLPALHAAEDANGIPRGLLVRQAYQESRFRPDIIDGRTVSSAGAVGIMQIVPRWHPGVDPLNPFAAIPYAAAFLAAQHARFGSWKYALAAYNWGPGNVARWIAGNATPPVETVNYMAQILADVPNAT